MKSFRRLRFNRLLSALPLGWAVSLSLWGAAIVMAQGIEPEGFGDSTNTGRAAGGIVQPFDRLEIRVKREPQLSDIYTVSPSGTLNFPLIGVVQASGRQAVEVAGEIEQRLAPYLRRPAVEAELLTFDRAVTGVSEPSLAAGGYSVYVAGAIQEPGVYYLNEPINALQLIVRAGGVDNLFNARLIGDRVISSAGSSGEGGITQIFPDLKRVSIIDSRGGVKFVDLSGMGQRDLDLEPLGPGDTVIIPGHTGGSYAVYGWVRRPGVFSLRQPILLTEALARSDPDDRFADLTKVKILRGDPKNPEVFTVNIDRLHSKKQIDLLPVIQAGDTIYVPRNFFSRWLDFVDTVRGARDVTEDVEEIRDHWTLRDIDRD